MLPVSVPRDSTKRMKSCASRTCHSLAFIGVQPSLLLRCMSNTRASLIVAVWWVNQSGSTMANLLHGRVPRRFLIVGTLSVTEQPWSTMDSQDWRMCQVQVHLSLLDQTGHRLPWLDTLRHQRPRQLQLQRIPVAEQTLSRPWTTRQICSGAQQNLACPLRWP